MEKICVGEKKTFAIYIELYTQAEIEASSKECEWWGGEYAHGILNIYVGGQCFGENSYFYPLQPTISSAIANPLNSKNYKGLAECTELELFDAFDYAYEEQPDIDDFDNPLEGSNSSELRDFINTRCAVDKYMTDFLLEYVTSTELSSANQLIGVFAFQKLETIVVRHGNNIRFVVRDDLDRRVSGVLIEESKYQQLWKEVESVVDSG